MQLDGVRVKFCGWHRWDERAQIPFKDQPGVYILALGAFAGEECRLTDKRIIYIGETCAHLAQRWRQFDRAAFKDGMKHSGGLTYKATIHKSSAELYVSACAPCIDEELVNAAFIRLLERKLLFDFVKAHSRLPVCNSE